MTFKHNNRQQSDYSDTLPAPVINFDIPGDYEGSHGIVPQGERMGNPSEALRAVFNALRMQGPTRSLAHDIAGSAAAADSVPADEALNPGSVVRNHGSRICARRYVSSLDATLNPRR